MQPGTILLLLLLSLGVSSLSAGKVDRKLKNLQEQVNALTENLEDVKQSFQRDQTKVDAVLEALSGNLTLLARAVSQLQRDLQDSRCPCEEILHRLDLLEGRLTAVEQDDCGHVQCQNGGSCVDGVLSHTCICRPGFRGKMCEENVDECATSPCQNGGSCRDLANGFQCLCPPGYYGQHCEHRDGGWGPWLAWERCSASCGGGLRSRRRRCDSPAPVNGGQYCRGPETQTEVCGQRPCTVDGGWGPWNKFGDCSVTCGQGYRVRTRCCDNPSPQNGGQPCEGSAEDRQVCEMKPCTVDGNWGPWTAFGDCNVTCGPGYAVRTRRCDSPPPQNGGQPCPGSDTDRQECEKKPCPVDGQWGEWGPYGRCSASCGRAVMVRHRRCDSPPPMYGGQPCPGSDSQSQPCKVPPCPVNGHWGRWSQYGDCSVSCGEGFQVRNRLCDNPAPRFGGDDCPGSPFDRRPCKMKPCPVDGQWGEWGPYGRCSASCGRAVMVRHRRCDSPPPMYGGQPCPGSDSQSQPCKVPPCPVDGQWGPWGAYGPCSVRCGGGVRTRRRLCDNPAPQNGGTRCPLAGGVQMLKCNTQACPVDGNWTPWGPWGPCPKKCGIRFRSRQRTCTAPVPQHGGTNCPGDSRQSRACPLNLLGCIPDILKPKDDSDGSTGGENKQ